MKKNKKVKYNAKLTRVMDEGESPKDIELDYGKVKIGFEILNQRDKATNNTRKHMTLDY